MPEEAGSGRSAVFGLTANRVRGLVIVVVVLAVVYFAIFESDPPPVFTEVEISIPPEPVDQFDEKTIVLPDFADSPIADEPVPAGVEINKVVGKKTPPPVTIAAPATVTTAAPAPATAATVAPVAVAAPNLNAGFFVQVVALAERNSAAEIAADLKELLGEPSFVQEVTRGGKRLYRVRLGPYGTDKGKALEVIGRLRQQAAKLGENAFVDEE